MNRAVSITRQIINGIYNPRTENSHKGTYGHALLIAGNSGKMGAAVICARACLRAGAGLTTVYCVKNEIPIIQIAAPEAMCIDRNEVIDAKVFSSIGIGPGIGKGDVESAILENLLKSNYSPLVLDADALNLLSMHRNWVTELCTGMILTPHVKEFDRLFGSFENMEGRIQFASHFCRNKGCIIVLKDWQTYIFSPHSIFVNDKTGNAGLAKGGSGDALTGIITALLAQKYSPENAAILGVYIHGAAADIAVENHSEEALLSTDVIENLGAAFRQLSITDW